MIAYDTSMTFGDLIARVGRELGLAKYVDGVATVPAGSLSVVKEAIWDGCDLFYRGIDPKTGTKHDWTFLTPTTAITMNSDASAAATYGGDLSKYRLPWFASRGRPTGEWWWSGGSTEWGGTVRDVSIDYVNRLHAGSTTTGYPQFVGIDVVPGSPNTRQGWYFRVWPSPDQAYTMNGRFPVWPPKMEATTERHLAGAEHDQTVIAAAVWAHFRAKRTPSQEQANAKSRFDEMMAGSILADRENRPALAGMMRDPSVEAEVETEDVLTDVPIQVNGVTV